MVLFTAGNLITLGIVFAALLLFRQLDQNNRTLEKVKKYGDKLKEELGVYVASREAAVKDYAIELDVQQKAAKELLKRLISTEEALGLKTENIAKIDERITSYDKSLDELMRMTARAQENLEHLQAESAFTDGVLKRVKEAREVLEVMEKDLPSLELQFQKDNDAALERISSQMQGGLKASLSDLASTAEGIERRVEDHREAVMKVEAERKARLERDIAVFETAFTRAQQEAQNKADQFEEASFRKLKDQSLERAQRFHTAVEEKLDQFQEVSKARLVEVQGLVKGVKDDWKKETIELEEKRKLFREEWKKENVDLATLAKTTRDAWKQDAAELKSELAETQRLVTTGGAALVAEASEKAKALATSLLSETRETLDCLRAELSSTSSSLDQGLARTGAELGSRLAALDQKCAQAEAGAKQRLSALEEEARSVETQVLVKASEDADRRQAELSERLSAAMTALMARLAEETEKGAALAGELDAKASGISERLDAFAHEVGDKLADAAEEAERRALENTEGRLEAYRTAALARFESIEALTKDVSGLDSELRRSMADTEARVRTDFAQFEKDAKAARDAVAGEFSGRIDSQRSEMDGLEKDLAALKERAYEGVSEKLKLFEDDFFADLSKRSEDIDRRLSGWKADLDAALVGLGEKSLAERTQVETQYADALKISLAEFSSSSMADLTRLKEQTGAFEEGIRDQMAQADQSLGAFKAQLVQDLSDARESASQTTKAEIARHALDMADTLKKEEREIEQMLRILATSVEERRAELSNRIDDSRKEIETWQTRVAGQLKDVDSAVEDARKRGRELAVESDERLSAIRTSIEEARTGALAHRQELFAGTEEKVGTLDLSIKEADRRIKEFVAQTRLFERSDELKADLEHRIEDLRGDIDKLDQRREEAAGLETQFVKIKRLEDEVNAKMTRFLSEKRRIELMEADFNRLITTSASVDEKLSQVTASDDTLTALQAQLRRLEDAIAEADAKYQRVEKKKEILDATADGIDRNFQALREAEAEAKKVDESLTALTGDISAIRGTIERLAVSKEKADEVTGKLATLDTTLSDIEGRIEEMQKAREWLARTETRMEEISRQAQDYVKIMGNLLKEEGRKGTEHTKGAPPIGMRESVVKLAHQGWDADQIARSLKISRGEVELILEISPKA